MSDETIADIIAEFRNKTGNMYDGTIMTDEYEFHSYADRIEEAYEKERELLKAYKTSGNAAAMREALELCVKQMCANCRDAAHTLAPDTPCVYGCETLKIAKAALAAPAKNGDIGTPEEQYKRWRVFCDTYDDDCTGCPCDELCLPHSYCFAKWAQLPYQQEGDK